ncbi:hypothetical protein SLS55_010263 [Diplodia seriata]|uniref:Bifunctional cytochrome P450/NADPH--P450 reductase n=1 Tax=Diplodia seriata TaxID=420778 RepID=A0ABR3BYT6_9PEZI
MSLEPIPQPPTYLYGMLANLPEIDPSFPLSSLWRLQALYGPIFQLDLISNKLIVLSSYELAHEVMDDEKFEKNWWKAHRTLMPVFGPMGVRKMFPEQLDIALAFDTIGICAFNYRFNNFYAEHMHPFATQMAASLVQAGKRAFRTQMENRLRMWSNKEMQDNIQAMHKLCDELVAERKAHPQPGVNDLLNTMLTVADPVTGEKLDDENIRYQMVTFLIAGHETTSGTLSYLFYNLLKNPEALHRAQQEVDGVLGDSPLTVRHLEKLKYVDACIKETLRLNGPIGQTVRRAKHDTVLGGRYKIPSDAAISINLRGMHSDPAVWGGDAAEFKPERMLHMDRYPPDAWKPFGVGMRSCIGRAFAEQEMLINVALLLQRFQVEMADPSYVLVNKSTLTIKPDGFFIKVRRRPGKGPMVGLAGDLGSAATTTHKPSTTDGASSSGGGPKKPMTILYGSNAGTCKAFAEDLQSAAPGFGFDASVQTLDQGTENVSTEHPVVVITSSYEGKPPDNAAKFAAWVEKGEPRFEGVRYAVFGVGNSEWAATYQRVPKLVDGCLERGGGKRIVESCWADVKSDCTNEWEKWTEGLWERLAEDGGGGKAHASSLRAEVIKHDIPVILGGKDMSWAVVKSARSLGGEEVGLEKREVEIELPRDMQYQAGDYFVVLPSNPPQTVARVLHRFGLHPDDLISISDTRKTYLQSKQPISAQMFFSQRVELNAPPTERQLATILAATESASERASLSSLASPSAYQAKVVQQNASILSLLEAHPTAHLPLPTYIDMLKPLSPRQYSIASSPLASHRFSAATNTYTLSLIYDVHVAPSWSDPSATFRGVASSYLAALVPGDKIHGFVRRTNNPNFRLPPAPDTTPVIMVAAGSGIAPMRGFVEERVALAGAAADGGKSLAPALLYFGCRDRERDFICGEELGEAEEKGVVGLRATFSKKGPEGEGEGTGRARYAYERMWEERDECAKLFRDGARILLCGSAAKLGKSTAETLKRIWLERDEGRSDADAEEWLQRVKEDRYVTDVFD